MVAIPASLTAVVNAKLTAAQWNASERDWISVLSAAPRVLAYQGVATTTLTTGVAAVLNLDTELYDADAMHSLVTNTSRLTVVTPGMYEVKGNVGFAANATGYRIALIYKNGAEITRVAVPATATGSSVVPVHYELPSLIAGDYIELAGAQLSGGNLATVVGSGITWISARWVATS